MTFYGRELRHVRHHSAAASFWTNILLRARSSEQHELRRRLNPSFCFAVAFARKFLLALGRLNDEVGHSDFSVHWSDAHHDKKIWRKILSRHHSLISFVYLVILLNREIFCFSVSLISQKWTRKLIVSNSPSICVRTNQRLRKCSDYSFQRCIIPLYICVNKLHSTVSIAEDLSIFDRWSSSIRPINKANLLWLCIIWYLLSCCFLGPTWSRYG